MVLVLVRLFVLVGCLFGVVSFLCGVYCWFWFVFIVWFGVKVFGSRVVVSV